MPRTIFLTTFFLIIIFIGLYVGINIFPGNTPEYTTWIPPVLIDEEEEALKQFFSKPTPAPLNQEVANQSNITQGAWIPDWDIQNGFKSLAAKSQYFNSVSPVWYYLNPEGIIQPNRSAIDQIRTFTRQQGIKLIPSIANFNHDEFHKVLDDDQKLEAHIDYLISEVEKYDYDGLDLDYESIYLDDQPEYLYLVRRLYQYLDSKGKTLTIAVMPNWSDKDIHLGLRQTRQAQDWHELAGYVHELRLMTYDVTGYRSQYPGPISPLDWNEAVLRYARSRADSKKVVLGLNLYGYDGWSNNAVIVQPYLGVYLNPYLSTGQADAITYDDLADWREYQTGDKLDPDSFEKIFTYNYEDKTYIVYYQDAVSAIHRFDLAREYGIAGVVHWRMGGEDLGVYELRR